MKDRLSFDREMEDLGLETSSPGLPQVTIVCGPIVRRTNSTSASIWIELNQDCVVHARALPVRGSKSVAHKPEKKPSLAVSVANFTVNVGGRFYALLTLEDLAPGWLYAYGLFYRPNEGRRNPPLWDREPHAGGWWEAELESRAFAGKRPTFRTFPIKKTEDIRIAFGSCRTLGGGFFGGKGVKGDDVFSLFGEHLRATERDRMKIWPHLLLLLGDHIYADNVDRPVAEARKRAPGRGGTALGSLNAPESILKWERERIPGETKYFFHQRVFGKDKTFGKVDIPDYAGRGEFSCQEFADYATLYVAAWTEPQVERILANLPTFMIFDDHEISNNWNITGGWVKQMKESPGWKKAVTDGLVAYWMYQGWGNPCPSGKLDERWKILERAALDGTDALDKLREWFEARVAFGRAAYYYEIEIFPPILVLDTRNDRSFMAPKQRGLNNVIVHADYDDEIISEEQWRWLRSRIDCNGPLILASGVPWLQLPCADVWLLRGTRPDIPLLREFEERSQENADIFEFYRRDIGTDQWTAFPKSFVKLTRELFNRGPFIFLSGDVHYAYGMLGRASFPEICNLGRNPMILHAVSSPLRSQWTDVEVKKNNPKFCLSLASGGTTQDMRRSYEQHLKANKTCDLSHGPADVMRLFLPDALPIFDHVGKKIKWTHINNIGILQVLRDGKSVKVSWLGASTKNGEALRELGSISSPLGGFVR